MLRGARSLVEARGYARIVLEPEPIELPDARPTLLRFVELRAPGPDRLSSDDSRAILRELKAVGGDLRSLRLALTGRRRARSSRPFSRCSTATMHLHVPGVRSESRGRGYDRRVRLYDTLTRSPSSSHRNLDPSACTSAAPPCTSGSMWATRVPSSLPWIRSWLRATGYDVTLVHNITDVDDKVYAEAGKQGIPSRELSERATAWFFEDTDDLGLGRPDIEPRATETIQEIVGFIELLVNKDLAYVANGDVYFEVASFPRLRTAVGSEGRGDDRPGGERAEARSARLRPLEVSEAARGRVLGISVGPGRPGWHIECSAMAEKFLGDEFEIHGGGSDLRFPHHENELAQSRSLDHPFARIWMHNGMLELDAAKMSKSLGNVVTLRNVLDVWGREALLIFHLSGFWSKPVDFDDEVMAQAASRAERFRDVFRSPHEARTRGVLGSVRVGARGRLQHPRGAGGDAPMARSRAASQGARHLRARVSGIGGRSSDGRRRAGEPPSGRARCR